MKSFKQWLNKEPKTPEALAKKHGVDVDYIHKQIKMGMKVEKEHTDNEDVARQIALNHLDEFKDYYTRLKKAEK